MLQVSTMCGKFAQKYDYIFTLRIFIPINFRHLGLIIVKSCKNEEEIAQTVDILEHEGMHGGFFGEAYDASFGSPCNGAAHFGLGAHQASSGQAKSSKWGFHLVDVLLKGGDVLGGESERGVGAFGGEIGANVE